MKLFETVTSACGPRHVRQTKQTLFPSETDVIPAATSGTVGPPYSRPYDTGTLAHAIYCTSRNDLRLMIETPRFHELYHGEQISMTRVISDISDRDRSANRIKWSPRLNLNWIDFDQLPFDKNAYLPYILWSTLHLKQHVVPNNP